LTQQTSAYLTLPTFEQPLTVKGQTSSVWYRALQGLFSGQPSASESIITPMGSPFAFTAPSGGFIILHGGTVSAVQFTRANTTLTGQTSGIFPLSQGDILTVTYSALPSMVFVPQ
jgi:hypothetical protein